MQACTLLYTIVLEPLCALVNYFSQIIDSKLCGLQNSMFGNFEGLTKDPQSTRRCVMV